MTLYARHAKSAFAAGLCELPTGAGTETQVARIATLHTALIAAGKTVRLGSSTTM